LAGSVSAQTDEARKEDKTKLVEDLRKGIEGKSVEADTSDKLPKSTKTELVDQFGTYQCEDIKARLENFQVMLNAAPKSRGVVYVYEGKSFNNILPPFGRRIRLSDARDARHYSFL